MNTGLETFVMGALGLFGTMITQKIKTLSGASGSTALTLTVIVCLVLAVIGAFATNAFFNIDGTMTAVSILSGVAMVFTTSTLAYKYLTVTSA